MTWLLLAMLACSDSTDGTDPSTSDTEPETTDDTETTASDVEDTDSEATSDTESATDTEPPTETETESDTDPGWDADCDLAVPRDHATLADALAAASTGQVLCLGEGTFTGNVDFGGRDLELRGWGTDLTVLEGDGTGPVVQFVSGESTDATLAQLTITGGRSDFGAGIYAVGGSFTLRDVRITANTCDDTATTVKGVGLYSENGGVVQDVVVDSNTCALDTGSRTKIYATGATLRGEFAVSGLEIRDNTAEAYDITSVAVFKDFTGSLEDLTISGNSSTAVAECIGAVHYSTGSDAPMNRVRLLDNHCEGNDVHGLGLNVISELEPAFSNVIIAGNTGAGPGAQVRGALYWLGAGTLDFADIVANEASGTTIQGVGVYYQSSGSGLSFSHVSIAHNVGTEATDGGALYGGGAGAEIAYSNVYDNGDDAFGGSQGPLLEDAGNVGVDPQYTDVEAWDFTLDSGSELVDAGDPKVLDTDGSQADIGAHGGPAAW